MKTNKTHDGQVVKSFLAKKDSPSLGKFLQEKTSLSLSIIKNVMAFGGVWYYQSGKKKGSRCRRVKKELSEGDRVEIYYDNRIKYKDKPFDFTTIHEGKSYGVYHKPSGQLTTGTPFGDRAGLLYYIERKGLKPFLVHRLDRETEGLVIVAFDNKTANLFSIMFQEGKVEKYYMAWLKGKLLKVGASGSWSTDISGKKALTEYTVIKQGRFHSLIDIDLKTGRTHQIRKHALESKFPVMGDPKYGRGNKDDRGLALIAYKISFPHPFADKKAEFSLETSQFLDRY